MAWLDTLIVGGIVIFGCMIMYKALQEPFDALFRLIAKGFNSIRESVSGEGGGVEEITYG